MVGWHFGKDQRKWPRLFVFEQSVKTSNDESFGTAPSLPKPEARLRVWIEFEQSSVEQGRPQQCPISKNSQTKQNKKKCLIWASTSSSTGRERSPRFSTKRSDCTSISLFKPMWDMTLAWDFHITEWPLFMVGSCSNTLGFGSEVGKIVQWRRRKSSRVTFSSCFACSKFHGSANEGSTFSIILVNYLHLKVPQVIQTKAFPRIGYALSIASKKKKFFQYLNFLLIIFEFKWMILNCDSSRRDPFKPQLPTPSPHKFISQQ